LVMELSEILRRQFEFDERHGGTFDWSGRVTENELDMLKFLLISLTAELGELAGIVNEGCKG